MVVVANTEALQQLFTFINGHPGDFHVEEMYDRGQELGLTRVQTMLAVRQQYKIQSAIRQDPLGLYTEVAGLRLYLYPPAKDCAVSADLLWNHQPEIFAIKSLFQQVPVGGAVLDVGANLGWHTLNFARHVGPQGVVYALEPDPENFALLQRNLVVNRAANVATYATAAADRNGCLSLWRHPCNRGDLRSYCPGSRWSELVVPVLRLDDLFGHALPRLDAIKMDIQGSEYFALLGMKALITAQPRLALYLEWWPDGLKAMGTSSEQLYQLLLEYGFDRFYTVDSEHEQLLEITGQVPTSDVLCLKG